MWNVARLAPFLGPALLATSLWGAVSINEVAFDEEGADWVELYNPGPGSVSVNGWRLDDRDTAAGNEATITFPAALPAGGFLLIYIDAAGPDDADFSDGSGTYYTGTATTLSLAATEDELGLYTGPLSSSTLTDFVAWVTQPPYGGAADQSHAAGQWPAGEAVTISDLGHGYSVGRVRDGEDANGLVDFRQFPRPTPGFSNVPGPSPYSDALQANPESFSPFDPDPAFQVSRLYFRTAGESTIKTIRIFDSRGRVVRNLVDNDRGSAGDVAGLASGFVVWDGRDDGGSVVPVGIYIAFMEASPPSGAVALSRARLAVGRRQ